MLKGSGRSIPGIHLRDALDRVSKLSPGLILKFGGHAMAAGLTIRKDAFDEFKELFARAVKELSDPEMFERNIVQTASSELPTSTLNSLKPSASTSGVRLSRNRSLPISSRYFLRES